MILRLLLCEPWKTYLLVFFRGKVIERQIVMVLCLLSFNFHLNHAIRCYLGFKHWWTRCHLKMTNYATNTEYALREGA